jgi:hypothetical protein
MKTNFLIISLLALALLARPIFAADVMHQRSAVQAVQAKFQYADTSVCSEGLVTNVVVIGELAWIAGNTKRSTSLRFLSVSSRATSAPARS